MSIYCRGVQEWVAIKEHRSINAFTYSIQPTSKLPVPVTQASDLFAMMGGMADR